MFEKPDEALKAYQADRCDSYTTDNSGLYSVRLQDGQARRPHGAARHHLQGAVGPAVRQDDFQWFTIVRWVHFALLNAEEAGVPRRTWTRCGLRRTQIKRLVGKEGSYGKDMGLDNDWVVRIIKTVGNYGEISIATWAGLAPEDRPRPEQALEERRPAVRAAHPCEAGRAPADMGGAPVRESGTPETEMADACDRGRRRPRGEFLYRPEVRQAIYQVLLVVALAMPL